MKMQGKILFSLVAMCLLLSTGVRAQTMAQATAMLPDNVKNAGVIKVATAFQWAPFAYVDEKGDRTGIDVDLMNLLATKLNVKAEFSDLKFPSIIPGISTGRYDVGINQIGVTPERLQTVDFVPYFKSQFSLLVKKGAAKPDINKLCGHTVAVTQGSAQVFVVEDLSRKCTESGQKAIERLYYPSSAETYMAVANGRGDGFMAAEAVAIYISGHNANLELVPKVLADNVSVSGIAIGKQNAQLKTALNAALRESVRDGSYQKILEKYGVPNSAYTEAK